MIDIMDNIIWMQYVTAFAAGAGASFLHHLGLWWTVRRLPSSRRPVLLSLASFYLRVAGVLAVFYLVMRGKWENVAVCMLGFLLVKLVMTRVLAPEAGIKPAAGRT